MSPFLLYLGNKKYAKHSIGVGQSSHAFMYSNFGDGQGGDRRDGKTGEVKRKDWNERMVHLIAIANGEVLYGQHCTVWKNYLRTCHRSRLKE